MLAGICSRGVTYPNDQHLSFRRASPALYATVSSPSPVCKSPSATMSRRKQQLVRESARPFRTKNRCCIVGNPESGHNFDRSIPTLHPQNSFRINSPVYLHHGTSHILLGGIHIS